jgi:hypothetical protein
MLARVARWVVAAALLTVPLAVGACEPVVLPHQVPGPPGCGMRDPSQSGPTTLSVAQQQVLRNQGPPQALDENEHGGRTWVYFRQQGSVFGERETAETFAFNAQGLLVAQKVETRRYVGK